MTKILSKIRNVIIRKIITFIDLLFHKLIKPKKNQFFFKSFNGLYTDSPKAISEELHKNRPDAKIIWVIKCDKNRKDLPNYIKTVKPNSLLYCFYKNRSRVIVDNGAGDYFVIKKKHSLIYRYLKNLNQLNISTWHGFPLKKIGRDIESIENPYVFSTSDILIANSLFEYKIFRKVFYPGTKIIMMGRPRNDILMAENINKDAIKKELNLPQFKKVLLYAPTYREAGNKMFDLAGILKSIKNILPLIENKFRGKFIIVLRVHHYMRYDQKNLIDNVLVFDGNRHEDMSKYLLISDILITDYSSSMFDYCILRRPCFLFVPDWAIYKRERGTYFDLTELPFPFAYTENEFKKVIGDFNENVYRRNIEEFIIKVGIVRDYNASEKIVDLILKLIN